MAGSLFATRSLCIESGLLVAAPFEVLKKYKIKESFIPKAYREKVFMFFSQSQVQKLLLSIDQVGTFSKPLKFRDFYIGDPAFVVHDINPKEKRLILANVPLGLVQCTVEITLSSNSHSSVLFY